MLFAKMLVSILVSNWIYAEICFFFPSVDTFVRTLYSQMQIPTHEKWGPILDSSGGKRLGHEVGGTLRETGLASVFPFNIFQDASLKAIYENGMSEWDPLFEEEAFDSVEFFRKETWHGEARDAFVEVDNVEELFG